MSQCEWTVGRHRITSYHNGLAYEVQDGRYTYFLQGDEATAWREGYDSISTESDLVYYLDEVMSELGRHICEVRTKYDDEGRAYL